VGRWLPPAAGEGQPGGKKSDGHPEDSKRGPSGTDRSAHDGLITATQAPWDDPCGCRFDVAL